MTKNISFGKYRGLLLAIVLFLVIDIGVLAFNQVASREIEHDASDINIAGELRMVSQQLAKALLTLEDEVAQNRATQTSLAQIIEARDEFDGALAALRNSQQGYYGELLAGHVGWTERGQLLQELAAEWEPLGRDVQRLLDKRKTMTLADIGPVTNKASARNLKLLQLSDDLTGQLEEISHIKTTQIRTIQAIAFSLALLNFIFIVFKMIRQLNVADQRAASAREETRKILGTVHEGLFLLHADGRIGEQRSASLDQLFGRPLAPRTHFFDVVLKSMLKNGDQFETAVSYVSMLFDKKMKPSLMRKLNPLVDIEIDNPEDSRQRRKFLSFDFEQVKTGDEVSHLLVSVFDVSQEKLLQIELAGAQARTKTEVEMLLGVIDQDPTLVGNFIQGARQRIDQINGELQNVRADAAAYLRTVNSVARNVHAIKGEAALLEAGGVERCAHQLEETLAGLRGSRTISGDDLIPIAVGVNELLDGINRVDAVVSRVARFARPAPAGAAAETDALAPVLKALAALGNKVASDLNKEIHFEADFPPVNSVSGELLRVCQEVLPQLVRNAVAHGIEHQDERIRNGKQPVGHVRVRFELDGANGFRVGVRDDGGGVSLDRLRRRAVDSGLYSVSEIEGMGEHQVVSMLFEPGFSTLEEAHLHAGRGDGLSVVREALASIGARLRLLSQTNTYTEFIVYKGA